MALATQKQVTAILAAAKGAHRVLKKFPPTLEELEEYRLQASAMTRSEADAKIKYLNSITGFDRATSMSTASQREAIARIERINRLAPTPRLSELTFIEASERLDALSGEVSAARHARRDSQHA